MSMTFDDEDLELIRDALKAHADVCSDLVKRALGAWVTGVDGDLTERKQRCEELADRILREVIAPSLARRQRDEAEDGDS